MGRWARWTTPYRLHNLQGLVMSKVLSNRAPLPIRSQLSTRWWATRRMWTLRRGFWNQAFPPFFHFPHFFSEHCYCVHHDGDWYRDHCSALTRLDIFFENGISHPFHANKWDKKWHLSKKRLLSFLHTGESPPPSELPGLLEYERAFVLYCAESYPATGVGSHTTIIYQWITTASWFIVFDFVLPVACLPTPSDGWPPDGWKYSAEEITYRSWEVDGLRAWLYFTLSGNRHSRSPTWAQLLDTKVSEGKLHSKPPEKWHARQNNGEH